MRGRNAGPGGAAGTGTNYAQITSAADFTDALSQANTALDTTVLYVSVKVGSDVVLFVDADSDGTADDAILLVGKSLTDIDFGNIT